MINGAWGCLIMCQNHDGVARKGTGERFIILPTVPGLFLLFTPKEATGMILLLCLLFFLGVLLAGCESELFPWLNLAGAAMVGVAGIVARKESS